MDTKKLINLIESAIAESKVQLTNFPGGGAHNHLGVMVISDSFENKPLLEQHQMVMDSLKEELKERLHAVKIKTITKKQFDALYA
ncbi:MAG: BolA family transcriptional regulator [Bdellovibrionaceae bacterium]|nr:BolA family transcriptional regulator [Pseudobdellovibrionaceae bacterium]